jgi:myosin-3
VRCIKPNQQQVPFEIDAHHVTNQLRYTGVLETIRIRREGFAYRPTFADFLKHFGLLAFSPHKKPPATPESCVAVLKAAGILDYRLG